ncbi:hypothetical protein M407DRAFT_144467 [Tulasnella calospora MUT 4182]|uniref:Uncharacterized protein n=1 Tax=Tulasnella calospora MUT 4182 TaxID=1051891 RepID=A0A0C3PXK3_9AGAM|nr:hypothetical protein M407DRAFT_144467 [Tulasnella calospora MUT 4182]
MINLGMGVVQTGLPDQISWFSSSTSSYRAKFTLHLELTVLQLALCRHKYIDGGPRKGNLVSKFASKLNIASSCSFLMTSPSTPFGHWIAEFNRGGYFCYY